MGGASYFGASHLEFNKKSLEKGRKLPKYSVINHKFGDVIGEIHWRGGWRQYVFEAEPGIEMSVSCMKEVIEFIKGLMKEWRESKKNGKK